MKALITGNLGFIGSHLADYLIDHGWEVVGLDNEMTGSWDNKHPNVQQYEADIRNLDEIKAIFEIEKPDYVFHEAANCRTMLSVDDPRLNNDINITGTLNVLLCARDTGVKKVVQASSCIVYAPNTPYYVSKLALEEYGKVFSKIYNLPVVSLRYSNVYGSIRQSEKGAHINAIASLRKSKRETGRIWITGDGEQTRDWTHVQDIARANLLACESNATGVFDVCTGISTSMNWIAQQFDCPIDYIEERTGDAKHLSDTQDQNEAWFGFKFKSEIVFNRDSLKVYLDD